jgi:hypothetical protein
MVRAERENVIPLLSSFAPRSRHHGGAIIPGNAFAARHDLVAPLMSCSTRLPVIFCSSARSSSRYGRSRPHLFGMRGGRGDQRPMIFPQSQGPRGKQLPVSHGIAALSMAEVERGRAMLSRAKVFLQTAGRSSS